MSDTELKSGLLDGADWAGNIFVDGDWKPGSAGDGAIIEPATGAELGRTGRAGPDDVTAASASASAGAAGVGGAAAHAAGRRAPQGR